MDANAPAGSRRRLRHADVDGPTIRSADPPQDARWAMREGGFGVCENCGHPSTFVGERWMTDGIDTPVDRVETAGLNSVPHSSRAQPQPPKLSESDDPMLMPSERRDPDVKGPRVTLRPYMGRKVTPARHGAMVNALGAPLTQQMSRLRRKNEPRLAAIACLAARPLGPGLGRRGRRGRSTIRPAPSRRRRSSARGARG
jgi:hypothetical protein